MPSYGVTSTGFAKKTEAEIKADLEADFRAKISPSLDVSAESVAGQIIGIVAAKLAEHWELQQAVYNAQYPTASGSSLDRVSAITGTKRKAATKSTVTVTCNVAASTTINAGSIIGSVSGNPLARFVSIENAVNATGSPANVSVKFEAEVTGPVLAPAGTLTVIEGVVAGLNSITNAADATPGTDTETDAALRLRRQAELSGQGASTVDALYSALSALSSVKDVEVLNNRTDYTDADGVPPHSVECIVLGGTNADIADAIWDNIAAGIRPYGTTQQNVTDSNGKTQEVLFTRPTEVRVYLVVDVTIDAAKFPADGDTQIKNAIANFTNGANSYALDTDTTVDGALGIGDDVILSKLYTAIWSVTGVTKISAVKAGTSPAPSGTADISISTKEICSYNGSRGIQTADITVNHV